MAKAKLSARILNAYRALRGDPWPVVFEGPKITYFRPAIQTIGAETSCPIAFMDLQGPEVTDERARRDIAALIGAELLDAGAIKITRDADIRAGRFYYRGLVRVVMPEKEDEENES
jgi:hypothetical protein